MSDEPSVALRAACASDVGRARTSNEDACLIKPRQGLFIVSDGLGGEQAGALASKIVVSVLPGLVKKRLGNVDRPDDEAVCVALRDAILELSQRLRAESEGKMGLRGMGATVVLTLVTTPPSSPSRRAYIAHMGDSRAYLMRDGRLEQLTDDHSVVGIMLRHGDITPKEAEDHPAKGRLSRYVGMGGEVFADVQTIGLEKGDRLLLCTDGLTEMVSDNAINDLLSDNAGGQSACDALIDAANAAGGEDNITAVVIDYGQET